MQVPKDDEDVKPDERMLLQKIFAQLRARTDRDFSHYKRATVMRRISRRMQINYLEDLPAYVEKLHKRPEEVQALADDLLITVTNFFRDPEVFEHLEDMRRDPAALPVEKSARQDTTRVWCVGCSHRRGSLFSRQASP